MASSHETAPHRPRRSGVTTQQCAGAKDWQSFGELASCTGGGVQTPGYMGHGRHFIASKKFIHAEGGIERIVWGSRRCIGPKAVCRRIAGTIILHQRLHGKHRMTHVLDINHKRKQNRKNRKEHIPMYQVTFRFENGQEEVKAFAAPDATLLEIAKSSNVAIDAPCNGNGYL